MGKVVLLICSIICYSLASSIMSYYGMPFWQRMLVLAIVFIGTIFQDAARDE